MIKRPKGMPRAFWWQFSQAEKRENFRLIKRYGCPPYTMAVLGRGSWPTLLIGDKLLSQADVPRRRRSGNVSV